LKIENSGGEELYSDYLEDRSLPAHSWGRYEFSGTWRPEEEDTLYHLTAIISYEGSDCDENPPSDTLIKEIIIPQSCAFLTISSNRIPAIFDWKDIAIEDNRLPLTGDDNYLTVNIPSFPFVFVDTLINSFHICTNGFLSLSEEVNNYLNNEIPCGIRDIIAVFWDDLLPGGESGIYCYHDTLDNTLIFTWEGINHFSGGGPYTFQVVFYSDGKIKYQYLSLNPPINSCTVGLQRRLGETVAINYLYNNSPEEHTLEDSLAILFLPTSSYRMRDVELSEVYNNFDFIGVETICTLAVEVVNRGIESVDFEVNAEIWRDDSLFYHSTSMVEDLPPFETQDVQFLPPLELPSQPDTFTALFYVSLDEDARRWNDTLTITFETESAVLLEIHGEEPITAVGGVSGSYYFAQGFIAPAETLFAAGISIFGAEEPYPDLRLELWKADDDNFPSPDSVVFMGTRLDGRREIISTPRFYSLGLDSSLQLEVDELYYLVINGAVDRTFSGHCGAMANLSNPYPDGAGYWCNNAEGNTWSNSPLTGLDFSFYVLTSRPYTNIDTGKPELPAEYQLEIYPNPVNSIVRVMVVSPTESDIKLTNTLGERLLGRKVPAGISVLRIDLGDYPSGVYWISIKDGECSKSFVLLK